MSRPTFQDFTLYTSLPLWASGVLFLIWLKKRQVSRWSTKQQDVATNCAQEHIWKIIFTLEPNWDWLSVWGANWVEKQEIISRKAVKQIPVLCDHVLLLKF